MTTITLTRRAATIAAVCLALAGGVGAGIVGFILGPPIFNQIDENREAIRVSCQLLNRAIAQSEQAAADGGTALLIKEILEGMTPGERAAYANAVEGAPAGAGAQKNTCSQIAAKAY